MTRPFPSALNAGATVRIAGRDREVVRRAGTEARPILRVTGCSTREHAEDWRGEPIWVEREVLPPLEDDEYYVDEVAGCHVFAGEERVGVVRRMYPLPSCHVLEVERPGGQPDLLVPFVRDAVRSIDITARRIDVDLGFLGET